MYPHATNELAYVIVRPLSIIFKPSWLEVLEDWRKANVTPAIKGKEHLGNYRLVEKNGLEGPRVRWTENCLNGQAQKIVISSTKSSLRPVN